MPPASMATSTCPGPGASGSRSSMRRSLAAWMTTAFMGQSSDDRREKRLTGKMRCQVVAHQLAHGLPRLHGSGRVMRLKDDVLQGQESLIDVRLIPEHIKAGALDHVALERIEQGCLIE